MLWQCSKEVMVDVWRARFGQEWVANVRLEDEKEAGDKNDWPYVARLLEVSLKLRRQNLSGRYWAYQLKE